MRSLTSLAGNSRRLDGGAMFGNVPKALWTRWTTPDEQNRIPLACRCLLVREPTRTLLFETGIGQCFPPKLLDRFGVVERSHVLLTSLAEQGLADTDIDVVVLSHLHFDHAGGLLTPWQPEGEMALLFPKAQIVIGRQAWERAKTPHSRDRASFLPELMVRLEDSGRVALVAGPTSEVLGPGYRFHFSHGHTPGLLLTEIDMPEGPVVFAGDLIPGTPWVHLPITMGYDRFPELLIDEKRALLADLLERQGRLFYTHDPQTALSRITRDDRGRYRATSPLSNLRDLRR